MMVEWAASHIHRAAWDAMLASNTVLSSIGRVCWPGVPISHARHGGTVHDGLVTVLTSQSVTSPVAYVFNNEQDTSSHTLAADLTWTVQHMHKPASIYCREKHSNNKKAISARCILPVQLNMLSDLTEKFARAAKLA